MEPKKIKRVTKGMISQKLQAICVQTNDTMLITAIDKKYQTRKRTEFPEDHGILIDHCWSTSKTIVCG